MTPKTAAARYARALFDVALAEDDPQVVEQQLAATLDVFTGHADLWRAVTNPAVPVQKKRAVVEELLPRLALQPVLSKLIVMMAGRDRLGLLPDLLETYRVRLMDHLKIVRAEITTAVPLSPERETALQGKLAALTGRTVLMQTSTSPDILGGVVARIGSTVYDGSVKRQLEKMRERLQGAV
jgi:F-type H+-transporting ATPase subunit delta